MSTETKIKTSYLIKQAGLSICDFISYPMRAGYQAGKTIARNTLYFIAQDRIIADIKHAEKLADNVQAQSKQDLTKTEEYRNSVLESLRMQQQVKELSEKYPELNKHEIYYQLRLGKDPVKVFAGRLGGKSKN